MREKGEGKRLLISTSKVQRKEHDLKVKLGGDKDEDAKQFYSE